MSHPSLDPRGLRAPILHALGDRTLYRTTAFAPADQFVPDAVHLAIRGDVPPQLFEFERELDRAESRRSAGRRALYQWADDLDRITVERVIRRGVGDETLADLYEDGLVTTRGGEWTLTLAGVAEAIDVRHLYSTRNVTTEWLTRTLTPGLLASIERHLEMRCRRSAHFNEISELPSNYFCALMARDGLKKRLRLGRHPSPTDLRQWAHRAALSQFRDEGRDALTRSFKGARTERDLRSEADFEDVISQSMPSETQAVFLVQDDEGQAGPVVTGGALSVPLIDAIGGNLEDEMVHLLSQQRGFTLLERAIRREKKGAPERFARLLHYIRDEMSFRAIGEAEGVSRNRAASLVADWREAARRAFARSDLAFRVLAYVRENPYSTVEDMEEPIDESADATGGGIGEEIPIELLDALVASGRLRREGNGCYTVTPRGIAVLDQGERLGMEIHAP